MFNGSGAPGTWVAYHRHHHSHTDTPEDISSPQQGGFWWAHLRWLYQSPPADLQKWCSELTAGCTSSGGAEAGDLLPRLRPRLGWQGFFWIGAIRLVYSLHMQCLVNSLTHLGHSDEGDSGAGCLFWWLGPLQFTASVGDNWHRNSCSFERWLGAPGTPLVASGYGSLSLDHGSSRSGIEYQAAENANIEYAAVQTAVRSQ